MTSADDLLAAMGGQAVHEQGVGLRQSHHLGIHLPVLEVAAALLVLGLEAHRGPHVGGDEIGAAHRIHRVGELLVMVGAVEAGALGLDFVAGRRRHMHVEAEHLGRLQPGVADVVGVADPGHRPAGDRAAMLDEGVDVGEDLAGMVFVGQAVDHRHARMPRESAR
jgi:hypothetical protein